MASPRARAIACALLAASVALAGTACARQPVAEPTPATPAPATSSPGATPSAAPRFPVTVDHDYGSTTLTEAPQRIVALDAEEDTLAAVGVTPLTYTPLPGSSEPAPWLGERLDLTGIQALDLEGGIDLGQIEDLHPDLILRTRALGGTRVEYRKLAKIAPTLYFGHGETWQDVSRAIGRAVGLGPEVDAAVAGTEDAIEAAGSDRPGLAGRTFAVAYVFDADGLAPLDRADPAAVLLRAVGLEIAPGLAGLGPATGRSEFGWADTARLDADLLLLAYADDDLASAFTAAKAFRRLRAVDAGAYSRLDAATFAQLRNPTLLSLPWALGRLGRVLDAAAGPSPRGTPGVQN